MYKVRFPYGLILSMLSIFTYGQTNCDESLVSARKEQALMYANQGLYEKAIFVEKELSNYFYARGEIGNYAISQSVIAAYYSDSGNYEQALEYNKIAMDCISDTTCIDDEGKCEIILHQAIFTENVGNHEEALNYCKQSLEIAKRIQYRKDIYIRCLTFLAFIYSELGEYLRAVCICSEAKNTYEQIGMTDTEDYIIILNDMGAYYCAIGDMKKAIELAWQYIGELERRKYNYQQRYIVALNNLARYYAIVKDNHEAIKISSLALELIDKYFTSNLYLRGRTLEHLSTSYANLGDYRHAKLLLEEALSLFSNVWADGSPGLVNEYRRYLHLSFLCNGLLQKESEIINVDRQISDIVTTAFSYLPNSGRNQYWYNYYHTWYTYEIPRYAYLLQTKDLLKEFYNSMLLCKCILLNTEIGVRQLMSGNDDALKKYYVLQRYKTSLLFGRLNTFEDSLIWKVEDEEMHLMSSCKIFGDYTKRLKVKWENIRNALQKDEVAIEFVSFPIDNDSVMYVALSLLKDSESPKMITLFEEKQLAGFPDSLHYQCQEMADLVWKPLRAELEGVKTIYFSPSGALYNIGIEYLPGMEDYDIYRLSSTRELVTREKDEPHNRAMLYGGLDYNAALDATVADRSVALLDESFKERANVRGMGLRGGREYLKQSKTEVDIINEELTKAGWQCVLDTAVMGTEESFKALSGRKIGWLHVATHGFYYTEEKADNARYQFMLMDNAAFSAEDRALTRSGLLLSGANHILNDEKLPDDVEDGVLTAREIADVDLRGLDLVVLSACQTGLGDIAQSEGVFGLQRGFKKAGANSILMSLWEVESDATMILMTQFYRNLLSGQGKRQALLSAQKYLRKVEGGKYDKPEYWAAFILLDGIEKQ